MASWTTPEDVQESWIGDDAPDDLIKIQTWIDKAEREIKFRVPGIQARIDAEAAEIPSRIDLLEDAKDVVVAMVTRKFQNPLGTRQKSITTGPFSEQQTFGGTNPGNLEMLESEVEKLSGSGTGDGAFTIDMIPATSPFSANYSWPTPWW